MIDGGEIAPISSSPPLALFLILLTLGLLRGSRDTRTSQSISDTFTRPKMRFCRLCPADGSAALTSAQKSSSHSGMLSGVVYRFACQKHHREANILRTQGDQ